jgi:DNA-directed RNA polymerase specialized sigma24 family protein
MVSRHSPSRTPSALRIAQYIFTRSACEPTTMWLDGTQFPELPDERLLLLPLRDLLLRPATTPSTRDAVWRELISRARTRESWLVAAMGMAMPGLRRTVRQLGVDVRGDREDVESAVAEGFVTALRTVDLGDTSLCARLVNAGRKAGAKQRYDDADLDDGAWSQFASHAPRPPWGHPDYVLLDAVAAGVLSVPDAQLIAATRLEDVPVADLAAELGLPTNTLVMRRHRAEERIRDAIHTGEVYFHYDIRRRPVRLEDDAPLDDATCESA